MAATKTNDPVQSAEAKAREAEKAAAEAKMSPEDKKVAEARQVADDERAKAAEKTAEAETAPAAMTVEEARMIVPSTVPPEMGAGDHMAQRFGNYPENPAPATAEHADPEKATVALQMIVPDHPLGKRTTMVHPEMVGDYERAGWSRA